MFVSPCRYGYCRRNRHEEPLERLLLDLAGVWIDSNPFLDTLLRQRQEGQKNWMYKLRLQGFQPNDIKVTTSENKVRVHARHVESKNGNSDVHESTRVIDIPKRVDISKLRCHVDERNVIIIEGPFIEEKENPIAVIQAQKVKNSGSLHQSDVSDKYHKKENMDVENKESNDEQIDDQDVILVQPKDNAAASEKQTKSLTESDKKDDGDASEVELPNFVSRETQREGTNDVSQDAQLSESEADDKEFEVIKSDIFDKEDNENTPTILLLQKSQYEETENLPKHSDDEIERKPEDFEIKLDLENYLPENISVLRKDNSLVVKAEKKGEHDGIKVKENYISEYSLPRDVDADNMSCVKNSDGKLVVTAPYQQKEDGDEIID